MAKRKPNLNTYYIILEDKIYRVSAATLAVLRQARECELTAAVDDLCAKIQDGKIGEFVDIVNFDWRL